MTISAPDRSTTRPRQARWVMVWWWIALCSTSLRRTTLLYALVASACIAGSLISAPGLTGVLGAGLGILMLAIAVIDARRFIIPNALTACAFVLALFHAAVVSAPATWPAVAWPALGLAISLAIARALALALFFSAVRFVYKAVRGRDGLGLGDVKLAGVAGAWLDWLMMPIAIELAAVAALVVYGLRQAMLGRALVATHRMPFGLFFAPAIWLCWFIERLWLAAF